MNKKPHKILYNSWYATEFEVTAEHQIALAKVMTNWVTDHEWHSKTTSLEFRFHVAMAGNLGVGCDLLKWSAEDVDLASRLIRQYKAVRHIIQLGDQYRLWNPFDGTRTAVQFVTRDGAESVAFPFQTLETESMAPRYYTDSDRLILKGLDPNATYSINDGRPRGTVPGKALMNSGIVADLRGNYSSRVIVIKRQ